MHPRTPLAFLAARARCWLMVNLLSTRMTAIPYPGTVLGLSAVLEPGRGPGCGVKSNHQGNTRIPGTLEQAALGEAHAGFGAQGAAMLPRGRSLRQPPEEGKGPAAPTGALARLSLPYLLASSPSQDTSDSGSTGSGCAGACRSSSPCCLGRCR